MAGIYNKENVLVLAVSRISFRCRIFIAEYAVCIRRTCFERNFGCIFDIRCWKMVFVFEGYVVNRIVIVSISNSVDANMVTTELMLRL